MTTQLPLLALHNVTVVRGESAERPALDGVSLRIWAGEYGCVLGPNGCGKSTLIKTITRECYPAAREGSSISILGRERWNIFELRSLLGIVSPDLLASLTTHARAFGDCASRPSRGFADVVRRSQAHPNCAGAGARSADAAV